MAKSVWDKDVSSIVSNNLTDEILFYRYEYEVSWKHIENTLIKEIRELVQELKRCQELEEKEND